MLITFKSKYLKNDPTLEKEFNYAINSINDRKIYTAGHDEMVLRSLSPDKRQTS
jgi:hypothetical protein